MTSRKQNSDQKAAQEKASRQKTPREGLHGFEQDWAAPALASAWESIQTIRSSEASCSQISRAALDLQRTVGNQAVVQLFRERAALTGARLTSGAGEKSDRNRQVDVSHISSVTAPTIQRRRVPEAGDLDEILTDIEGTETPEGMDFEVVDAPNLAAHQAGLVRIIRRAANELTDDQKWEVILGAFRGMSLDEINALPEREKLTRLASAITEVVPDLELGDPGEYNIGARPKKDDVDNIRTLVANCNGIFDAIAAGTHDTSLGQVFGTSKIGAAKRKYRRARSWMNILHRRNRIVTDRSGYSEEVGLGGLTGFQQQISVAYGYIDSPDDTESIITMIHESMHAGNANVDDRGYIDQPSFQELDEAVKLNNAAHFEVVPRRIRVAEYAFLNDDGTGMVFVPAGTGATPALTDRQQAIRGATETFREAWTTGLNLYEFFVRVHNTPREWTRLNLSVEYGAARGVHFSDCLPFWSQVLKLTVHEKTTIDPTSSDPSVQPVSVIDIALLEGAIRKLAIGMKKVPKKEADALAFEWVHATPAEIAAATTVAAERDLLIKLVIKTKMIEVTGPLDRDFRMVNTMASNGATYSDMLTRRAPADFPD